MIWIDYNENNAQDIGEPGLPAATITLEIDYNTDGTPDVSVVTVSSFDGSYSFDNLLLDEDYNGVTGSPNYELSVTLNNPEMNVAYFQNTPDAASEQIDSDDHDGQAVLPIQGKSSVELTADASTEASEASFDFGYTFDCSNPIVDYAITMDATDPNASQTTDYFVDSTSHTYHSPMSQKNGAIQSRTYCEVDGWHYYYNPQDPNEYLFAIEMGANTTPIDYITIRVDDDPANRYQSDDVAATFVMIRDWHVQTVNNAPLTAPVNVRFYFPPNEYKQMLDAAKAQATAWGVTTVPDETMVQWFKKDTFNPSADINAANTVLYAFDITNLRNANSDENGNNTALASPAVENTRNHIQFNNITGFSGGTAMIHLIKSVLPIELSMFKGINEDCDARLIWSSENEENFSHYEIQRSKDGKEFSPIGRIKGIAGQFSGQNYQYLDKLVGESNYYRLKMIDLDGQFEYSPIVQVDIDCDETIEEIFLYPNPVGFLQNELNVKLKTIEGPRLFIIYDILGNVIKSMNFKMKKDWNIIQIDISDLPAGSYVLRLSDQEIGQPFVILEK